MRALSSCMSCLFAVGILTGCTSLATTFNRIHAAMTKDETPEESHYYGAYFIGPSSTEVRSLKAEGRKKKEEGRLAQ